MSSHFTDTLLGRVPVFYGGLDPTLRTQLVGLRGEIGGLYRGTDDDPGFRQKINADLSALEATYGVTPAATDPTTYRLPGPQRAKSLAVGFFYRLCQVENAIPH